MKKIILGLVIGLALSGGTALAKVVNVSSWYVTDHLDMGWYKIDKTYDEDTNIVCYSFNGSYAGGISCLKNN